LTYGKRRPYHVTFCKTVGSSPQVYGVASGLEMYSPLYQVAEVGYSPLPTKRFQQVTCLILLALGIPQRAAWVIKITASHLNYFVEFISVNVGGSCQDIKASSLSMPDRSVGGFIVV